jgi:acyl-CoA thioester hydrolase
MTTPPRRRKGGYFAPDPRVPPPLAVRLTHRIRFSDVDPMAVLWHGRYAQLFEIANEELGRRYGLAYTDFRQARLAAPIVQLHVDYFAPVTLGELVSITGQMLWSEGARMNIQYAVHKENGALAAAGYTVQMFVGEDAAPLLVAPPILETCRARWRAGELGGAP